MYKARRNERTGKIACVDPQDQAFSRSCFVTVGNEEELEKRLRDGWRENPTEAIEAHNQELRGIAEASANRAYEDLRLSEKAQAEAKRKDAELGDGISHNPEIPEDRLDKSARKCAGKTAKGAPCKRRPVVGELYCKPHLG
jgi:hypothetical protein